MPSATSFSVNDRENTPVSHTFVPNGFSPDNSVAFFKEAGANYKIEDIKYSISGRESAQNRKVKCKLEVPVVVEETINGVTVPKVVRTAYGEVTFTFPLTSSEQERDNLVGMLANSLASSVTVINSVVVGDEAIW